MKVNRSEKVYDRDSDMTFSIYDVNDLKYIMIEHQKDNSIEKIHLVEVKADHTEESLFNADGLLYLENVCHGEDNEILDTNLLCMAERCFSEVC